MSYAYKTTRKQTHTTPRMKRARPSFCNSLSVLLFFLLTFPPLPPLSPPPLLLLLLLLLLLSSFPSMFVCFCFFRFAPFPPDTQHTHTRRKKKGSADRRTFQKGIFDFNGRIIIGGGEGGRMEGGREGPPAPSSLTHTLGCSLSLTSFRFRFSSFFFLLLIPLCLGGGNRDRCCSLLLLPSFSLFLSLLPRRAQTRRLRSPLQLLISKT